jgi:hypothetical protein
MRDSSNGSAAGRRWRRAAVLLAGVMLASCGGGGDSDSGSTSTTPASTTKTKALTGSQGHPERYLGTWSSGCGWTFQAGPVKSVQNTWQFTAVSGSTLTGSFEQRQYSDMNCTTPWPTASFTVKASATLAVMGETALTPGTGSVIFTGIADKVQVTLRQTGAAPDTSVQHAGFEGEAKLRFTQSLPFSTGDLEYDRR